VLSATPEGTQARAFSEDALDEIEGLTLFLSDSKPARVRAVEATLRELVALYVAGITAIQGRGDRFAPGRHFDDEVSTHWRKLNFVLPRLVDNGLPDDRSVFFEGFSARGKPETAAWRMGLVPDDGIRFDFKADALTMRGASKEPTTGGLALEIVPSGPEFTMMATFTLPEKLSRKQRQALTGFSAGLYLASDGGATPATSFVVEHQASPEGFVQSFVADGPAVVQIFPHGAPSLERRLRTFLTKDADSITLGVLQKDGDVETLHSREIPLLADLPYVSFYLRNGTKRSRVEVDNLLVFLQPYVIHAGEPTP
jgi:hypothetical protein